MPSTNTVAVPPRWLSLCAPPNRIAISPSSRRAKLAQWRSSAVMATAPAPMTKNSSPSSPRGSGPCRPRRSLLRVRSEGGELFADNPRTTASRECALVATAMPRHRDRTAHHPRGPRLRAAATMMNAMPSHLLAAERLAADHHARERRDSRLNARSSPMLAMGKDRAQWPGLNDQGRHHSRQRQVGQARQALEPGRRGDPQGLDHGSDDEVRGPGDPGPRPRPPCPRPRRRRKTAAGEGECQAPGVDAVATWKARDSVSDPLPRRPPGEGPARLVAPGRDRDGTSIRMAVHHAQGRLRRPGDRRTSGRASRYAVIVFSRAPRKARKGSVTISCQQRPDP